MSGVRSRCERSAAVSRSWSSRDRTRPVRVLNAVPTCTSSSGPAGSTAASRSPRPSRWVADTRSVTGRTTARPMRSATSSARPIRAAASNPRMAQAVATFSVSVASSTPITTTHGGSWARKMGTITAWPSEISWRYAWPRSVAGVRSVWGASGEPMTTPLGRTTDVWSAAAQGRFKGSQGFRPPVDGGGKPSNSLGLGLGGVDRSIRGQVTDEHCQRNRKGQDHDRRDRQGIERQPAPHESGAASLTPTPWMVCR